MTAADHFGNKVTGTTTVRVATRFAAPTVAAPSFVFLSPRLPSNSKAVTRAAMPQPVEVMIGKPLAIASSAALGIGS